MFFGRLPSKINKRTKGINSHNNSETQILLESLFPPNSQKQFVIIDNYNYKTLDEILCAKVPFEKVEYPTEISAQNGITQLKVQKFLNIQNEDKSEQTKSYMELIKLQSQIAKTGFLFPASNDYLMVYGFRQIVIGYGCKNHCTYCAVRFAKNKIESTPLEQIVNQIRNEIKKGYRKFVLVADDFGSWGLDISSTWVDLLEHIDQIECEDLELAIFNIKAEDLLEHKEIIDRLAYKGKIKYICVMSQHVNSAILKRMGRIPFDKNSFIDFINEYGNLNIQIETFNIIGFPGESEEYFNELCDFITHIKTAHYANYSTPFSPRYGTPAYDFDDRIPEEIVLERVKKINNIYRSVMDQNFSVLPEVLHKKLNLMLEKLDQHEFDYENSLQHNLDFK